MVKVNNAFLRESKEGHAFVTLELTGDLELVLSKATGRYYATIRRCIISSTFDLETAKHFIGKFLPGRVSRVNCDPYEYTVPETGEVITLGYSYRYMPDSTPDEAVVKPLDGLVNTIAA